MKLPPELIDEIIGHLPPDDKESLQNCSLVTKSWIRPSQKRLFEVVDIRQQNLQSWLDTISPTNLELLGHVRRLSYKEYPEGAVEPAHQALRDHLPSLHQLRHFTLLFARISSHPQQIGLFSAFQHTLSGISLVGCGVTKNAFVTLVNYFPNLTSLYLYGLGYNRDDEPTPPLSRTLFKKLYITVWPMESLVLLDELSKSGMRFEEVDIATMISRPTWPEVAKRVVDVFGASARILRILGSSNGTYLLPRSLQNISDHISFLDGGRYLALSHCQELREFEAFALYLNDAELDLISSITSTKIEKIIFTHAPAFELSVGHTYWTRLDDALVKLAERSKRKLRLEVAFRCVNGVWDDKPDLRKYLPRFVEKGRMTVLGHEYEVLYSSDEVKGAGNH